ncbi:MAG: MFS transporter [Phenylobacterium sp.]|uniref:peptide MFS transporter n=1 Tax=Phenylobacterium sp. TaxID=1871053 RepID=UPI0025F54130|nr:oligopeptide:H+ symporter [Phenylobacterium sp.]MBA4012622.1 MFS transporter [Phenylobacterium sp.]
MNIVILLGIVITLATGIPVLMQLLKQHPRGLIILFFAEMWERFSYYGMRGILIFFLTQHLLFDDATAGAQYGSYTSLVYLLPLIGGLLADRYLGTRKAVAFGALLLVAGHLTMAVEGKPATQQLVYGGQKYEVVAEGRMESRTVKLMVGDKAYDFGPAEGGGLEIKGLQAGGPLPTVLAKDSYTMEKQVDPLGKNAFYLAVSLIIMGVGFLKPNISTIVGQLYPQGDPRRDSGFTLYYYGINLGAFWASVLCGLLGQTVGWWAGFGLAGVGMALGWIVFVLGKPLLQGKGEPPNLELLKAPIAGPINREWLIYILAILGVAPIWLLVQSNQLVGWALGVSTILALAFIAYFLVVKCGKIERERMMLALVLIFGSVVFFTLFEQAGTSLNLFAARNVDLMGISAAQTQSFNAGFILIFAPIFAALWAWLGARGRDPNPTLKFGFGLLQVGLGFLVVVWAQGLADDNYRLPLIMLALLYMLHTTGELFLSPVGLSEITKLSVASVVSFMMAVWFLSSSIAQYVGGIIAGAMGTETVGGQVLDPAAALATSMDGFNKLGWAGVGVGVVFVVLSFFIKHWAHGANNPAHAQPEPIAPVLDGERQAVNPAAIRADRES